VKSYRHQATSFTLQAASQAASDYFLAIDSRIIH